MDSLLAPSDEQAAAIAHRAVAELGTVELASESVEEAAAVGSGAALRQPSACSVPFRLTIRDGGDADVLAAQHIALLATQRAPPLSRLRLALYVLGLLRGYLPFTDLHRVVKSKTLIASVSLLQKRRTAHLRDPSTNAAKLTKAPSF